MVWCEGTVEDAIRISKSSRNILFFLFEDDNEEGRLNILRNLSIASFLESTLFVGVRVSTSSELFIQFSAIYHFIPTPCLIFLRHDGQPIDIISDDLLVEEAFTRIQQCMIYAASNRNPCGTTAIAPSGPSKVENAAHVADSAGTRNPVSSEKTTDVDKVSQMVDAMKKPKIYTVTLDTVHNSVSEDYPPKKSEKEAPSSSHVPEASSSGRSNTAHVQFRLPSGDTHTHLFSENTTVLDIFKYVEQNLVLPVGRWTLSLSYPRRELSLTEGDKTVLDVGLVPNGVILIISATGEISHQSFLNIAGNLMYTLVSTPVYVVNTMYTYIYSLIFGLPRNANVNSGGAAQGTANSAQPATRFVVNENVRRRTQPTTSVLRDGNIHRLTFRQDESEDENNTWNGNSTQQM